MTAKQIAKFFQAHNDDFLEHKKIPPERRLHQRPDLNAFLVLAKHTPKATMDMVAWAEHDEIGLDVEAKDLKTISEEELLDLIRCGVMLDDGCFKMFA